MFISPKPVIKKLFSHKTIFKVHLFPVIHEISHSLNQLLGEWNKVSLPYVFHFWLLFHSSLWWLLRNVHPKEEFIFLCNFSPHEWLNHSSSLPEDWYIRYRHNMYLSNIMYRHKFIWLNKDLWQLSGPTACSKQGQFSSGCSRFRAARSGLPQLIIV